MHNSCIISDFCFLLLGISVIQLFLLSVAVGFAAVRQIYWVWDLVLVLNQVPAVVPPETYQHVNQRSCLSEAI